MRAPGSHEHLILCDAAIPERNIRSDVAGKQKHVLQNKAYVAAQRLFVPLADIDAVDEYGAAIDVVKPAERGNRRGLAAARCAHQSDFLAGTNVKGNPFEAPAPRHCRRATRL